MLVYDVDSLDVWMDKRMGLYKILLISPHPRACFQDMAIVYLR